MQISSFHREDGARQLDQMRGLFDDAALQSLLDHLSDGVVVTDRAGIVLFINSQARHLNDFGDRATVGENIERLLAESSLNHDGAFLRALEETKREFLLSSTDGRSVLGALRLLGGSDLPGSMQIVVLRDLQLIDHQRRVASGDRETDVFRFMSHPEGGPDFEAQRRISSAVDQTLRAGYRAMSQGAHLLLTGESGSGKTEIARYLHRIAGTPEEPFVHVNCGAIPDSLFESEMFGYEKGAFTDALRSGKPGLIESADGGTLFLDEIGEIPVTSQAKLLKFLEDGMVQRIGSRQGRPVNIRLVSATNRNLWQLVQNREFRNDLYYRLAVINLEVRPLREQPGLIDHLIDHFLGLTNRMRQTPLQISSHCRKRLLAYRYHGNIRELHNLIQHLSVVADHTAEVEHLPQHLQQDLSRQVEPSVGASSTMVEKLPDPDREPVQDLPLKQQVREYELGIIQRAISQFGSKRKAAQALGVDIGTIVRKTRV